MSDQNLVKVYDSQGDEYGRAFGVFLAHTDQKVKATAWLEQEVNGLATREVFIDAGAGTGKLTAWLEPRFQKTIAIEPNPSLRDELQQACPEAELLSVPIAEARPSSRADFVLCSHVFYYIDRVRWTENLRYLADWLQPAGVLSVALQNHETDCMRMLRHFTGVEFDLRALARVFAGEAQSQFDVRTETVEAHVQTDSFASAYIIAEFVLNVLRFPILRGARNWNGTSGTTFAVVTATACPSTKTSCESKEGHEHREGRGDRHRGLQRSTIHVSQKLKRRGPLLILTLYTGLAPNTG